jgi:hypothetical protein
MTHLNGFSVNRDDERYQSILARGGDFAKCDWCVLEEADHKRLGTDYHELFQRALTNKGSEARNLSYQKELCSWLCNPCHIGLIHGRQSVRTTRLYLIEFNIRLWGYDVVKMAWERLDAVSPVRFDFAFPEYDETYHGPR